MFRIKAQDGEARLGELQTSHGNVETPAYVVVATEGKVRTLSAEDVARTGTQMVISNTYHLWRTLGEDGLADFPGLHAYMGWDGAIMTDSGGFQVFSMGFGREFGVGKIGPRDAPRGKDANLVRVTDSGVYFMENGEEIYLDAELSMRIQEQLRSDIVLAFDEPNSPLHDREYTRKAMERTHAWAERSLEAKTSDQKIYGIVQGGLFEDLRKESAGVIGAMPFDGFAIGGAFGSSFGSGKEDTWRTLAWVNPLLPAEKPRHLLGIGRIDDVFFAVERGVDTFDCVVPTREARHGAVWTKHGRYEITKGKFSDDENSLEEGCACPVCNEGITRGALYALFKEKNSDAGRLATIHNVYFFNNLMAEIREAIKERKFAELKSRYVAKK